MQTETQKKLFTVEEYYKMGEAGILPEGRRFELIAGEIMIKPTMGPRHAAAVHRATRLFTQSIQPRAIVSVQCAVRLDDYNQPEPDLGLLAPREDFYVTRLPGVADIFLLLEIADTSLRYDRDVKLPIYAILGIPEVWIEDVKNQILYVYRDPVDDRYQSCLTFRRGDSVASLAFPDIRFAVDDILP